MRPNRVHQLICCGVAGVAAAIAGCDPPAGRELAADTAFIDITKTAFDTELPAAGWTGLALFDYDNDGDIDILVTNIANLPNLLYRNDGDGTFKEVADEAGIRFTSDTYVSTGVGDFDNDGWLDLILCRQITDGDDPDRAAIQYLKNLGPDDNGVVRFADATR